MSKTKVSTARAAVLYGMTEGVRDQVKYERDAAKLLGITVSEVRNRIERGRKAKAEQERKAKAESVQKSIRYSVEQLRECLTDIEDLASAIRRGDHDGITACITAEGLAHGVVAITGRAEEFLCDLCRDLGMGDDHAE